MASMVIIEVRAVSPTLIETTPLTAPISTSVIVPFKTFRAEMRIVPRSLFVSVVPRIGAFSRQV